MGDALLQCPCCSNPWTRRLEREFAVACETCMDPRDEIPGMDLAKNIDPAVSPRSDFYEHANGQWKRDNPVPADRPMWNSFAAITEKNHERLQKIFEGLPMPAPGEPCTTIKEKVACLFADTMDVGAIDEAGIMGPLAPLLELCDLAEQDPTAALAGLHGYQINAFFSPTCKSDMKRAELMVLDLRTAEVLGLPDRDYFFEDSWADLREQYLAHVARTFLLLGESREDAEANAESVMAINKTLAAAHLTRAERCDPETMYNLWSGAKVAAHCKGGIEWPRYFELIGCPNPSHVQIGSPCAVAAAVAAMRDSPPSAVRAYLRVMCIKKVALDMSKPMFDHNFEFYNKVLFGQQQQRERSKLAMEFCQEWLGMGLGQLYVRDCFSADAKAKVTDIVQRVKAALESRLGELEWMSPETRGRAIDKVRQMQIKIGYPDEWMDYSELDIRRGSLMRNTLNALKFVTTRSLRKVGKPSDRAAWVDSTPPQEVNAFYRITVNDVYFPAGLLQPPFFDPTADAATNFGALGAIVGHEMTHGFDYSGRHFDGLGNLRDWWTPADAAVYEEKMMKQIKQAEAFKL
jgi:putative endopeptidase